MSIVDLSLLEQNFGQTALEVSAEIFVGSEGSH